MGRVPGFLLKHRVSIEPYLGVWGLYGPPVGDVRCAKEEKLNTAQSAAGQVRYLTVHLVADLDVVCPEGSIITLADGRRGYAHSVARNDSAGMPGVPDHTAIAFTAAAAVYGPPLGGETVTLLRRVKVGVDRYQNVRYSTVQTVIDGAAVRPLSATEQPDGGGSRLVDAIEIVLPPGSVVDPVDQLRVRGLLYEVDGRPEPVHDPMTGAEPGLRVIGRRVSG